MNNQFTTAFLAALLLSGATHLYGEDEAGEYYVFDDEKTYIIHGPSDVIVPDSHIVVSKSWWTGLSVTIDNTKYNKDALQKLDIEVTDGDEPTPASKRYTYSKSVVDKEDFIAAVKAIYGVDGEAWLAACDEPSLPLNEGQPSYRFAYIELAAHRFNGPDWYSGSRVIDGGYYHGLLSIDNDVDEDEGKGPVKCAQDFATWVEARLAETSNIFSNRLLIAYYEMDEAQELTEEQAVNYIEGYRTRLQGKINDFGKTVAAVTKAYYSLPGIINAPYGLVLACNDLSDGEFSAALDIIPFNRIPFGKVWKLARRADGTGEEIATITREISQVATRVSHENVQTWRRIEDFVADPVIRQAGDLSLAAQLVCKFGFCFASGTPVTTPRGLVPIDKIRSGDYVVAYDEETTGFVSARVISTYEAQADAMIDIEIARDSAQRSVQSISATPNHPFLLEGEFRRWVTAAELKRNDVLVSHAGRIRVLSAKYRTAAEPVHNLRLESQYTYLVGHLCVVVHNKACALDELAAYKSQGKLLALFEDYSPQVLQTWFRKADGSIDKAIAKKFADGIRRLASKKHEWVPVNRLYNSIYKPGRKIDRTLASKLIKFMAKARIDTGKLWFNNKISKKSPNARRGYNQAGQPLGHPGISSFAEHADQKFDVDWTSEFHNDLNNAFEMTLTEGNGTFSPTAWKAKIEKFLPSYFRDEVLESVQESLSDAVLSWNSL